MSRLLTTRQNTTEETVEEFSNDASTVDEDPDIGDNNQEMEGIMTVSQKISAANRKFLEMTQNQGVNNDDRRVTCDQFGMDEKMILNSIGIESSQTLNEVISEVDEDGLNQIYWPKINNIIINFQQNNETDSTEFLDEQEFARKQTDFIAALKILVNEKPIDNHVVDELLKQYNLK
ncbi:hypothetical protein I4U23_025878 [Adineta vaga]|nr:hypothetical protein I4U23_025878 [Adineta vaga]